MVRCASLRQGLSACHSRHHVKTDKGGPGRTSPGDMTHCARKRGGCGLEAGLESLLIDGTWGCGKRGTSHPADLGAPLEGKIVNAFEHAGSRHPVVSTRSPPANAGDTVLIPGPGGSHVLQHNWAHASQLLSPCSATRGHRREALQQRVAPAPHN